MEQNTKQAGSRAGQEEVSEKLFASPGALKVRSKYPQGIQIEEDVEPTAMNEKVGDQLKGKESMDYQPGTSPR